MARKSYSYVNIALYSYMQLYNITDNSTYFSFFKLFWPCLTTAAVHIMQSAVLLKTPTVGSGIKMFHDRSLDLSYIISQPVCRLLSRRQPPRNPNPQPHKSLKNRESHCAKLFFLALQLVFQKCSESFPSQHLQLISSNSSLFS